MNYRGGGMKTSNRPKRTPYKLKSKQCVQYLTKSESSMKKLYGDVKESYPQSNQRLIETIKYSSKYIWTALLNNSTLDDKDAMRFIECQILGLLISIKKKPDTTPGLPKKDA